MHIEFVVCKFIYDIFLSLPCNASIFSGVFNIMNYFSVVAFVLSCLIDDIFSLKIPPSGYLPQEYWKFENTSHCFYIFIVFFKSFYKAWNTSVRIVLTHKMDKLDIPDLAEKYSVSTSIFRIKCIWKNYIWELLKLLILHFINTQNSGKEPLFLVALSVYQSKPAFHL